MSDPVTIKVRGYHLDVYAHVNNARYLEFLEEARWAFFEGKLDLVEWRKRHLAFVLVNMNINFRWPASLGDVLQVSAEMDRVGTKSAVMRQQIRLKESGQIVLDADVVFVMMDERTGRAVPLEGEPRAIIEGLIKP